jgi:hypothetical protein
MVIILSKALDNTAGNICYENYCIKTTNSPSRKKAPNHNWIHVGSIVSFGLAKWQFQGRVRSGVTPGSFVKKKIRCMMAFVVPDCC